MPLQRLMTNTFSDFSISERVNNIFAEDLLQIPYSKFKSVRKFLFFESEILLN